jgi:hypothetical protein
MKALSAIFKEAQKAQLDADRPGLIVKQCAGQLREISVQIYKTCDLPSAPEKGRRVLIGAAFYSLYDLELLDWLAIRRGAQNLPPNELIYSKSWMAKAKPTLIHAFQELGRLFRLQSLAYGAMVSSWKKRQDVRLSKY